jgi:hypothetical protein
VRCWPAIVVLLGAGAAEAQGFRRTEITARDGSQQCLYWNVRDITWHADAAGSVRTPADTEFVATQTAFASWQALSNTCSDFTVTEGGKLTNPPTGKGTQAEHVVTFRETNCSTTVPSSDACLSDGSCANKFRCWDHGDLTIALTTNTYSVSTAVIVDSDIELNAGPSFVGQEFLFTTVSNPVCDPGAQSASCVATDVQNTLTHEIGHLFGFDHVDDERSTMAATSDVGDLQKRAIDRGTADGFCLTYPRGQPATPCDELAQLRRKVIAKSVGTPGLAALGCDATGGLDALAVLMLMGMFLSRALTRGREQLRGRSNVRCRGRLGGARPERARTGRP